MTQNDMDTERHAKLSMQWYGWGSPIGLGIGPVRGLAQVVRYRVRSDRGGDPMIGVEHVDFISIPTQDVPRAKRFYGELLGLELEKDTLQAPSTARAR